MFHHFTNPYVWFWIALAYVWARRSAQALKTIHASPSIEPRYRYPESQKPLVSVIIPAKNEENNIGLCLQSLRDQDYPDYEILVANDSSADRTEEILKSFGDKIRYVNVSPTPKGWTGKNFAIHSAIGLARGEWFLFTDADTRHERSSISAALSHAEARGISFLTLLPRCLAEGFLENVLQPCMMGFTGLWFPLDQVNDPRSQTFFANGQYLLMESGLYRRIGGHHRVCEAFLEDFALMKNAKAFGAKVECALGISIYGTRMYHSFSAIWRGWRRIFLHAHQKNIGRLLFRMADVFLTSFFPFVIPLGMIPVTMQAPADYGFLWGMSVIVLGFIEVVAWRAYGIVKAKRRYVVFFPLGALALVFILLNAAWVAASGQKTKWR